MNRSKPSEVPWEIDDVWESKKWEEVTSTVTQLGDELPELLKALKKGIDSLKGSTILVNDGFLPLVMVYCLSSYFPFFFLP